jgi:hypothetical protein
MEVDMARESTGGVSADTYRRFLGFICWETGRDARNMMRFAGWFALTAFSREAVNFAELQVSMPAVLAWVLALVPALPAFLTIMAYRKFLREADEMIRHIHITGLAVGCGAAFFVSLGLQVPLSYGDPFPYKDVLAAAVTHKTLVFMAMIFGWVYGQRLATRRYK